MYLGHFDAVGLAHWEQKWRMRAEERTHSVNMPRLRKRQMALFLESMHGGERSYRDLLMRYYGLTRLQYFVLCSLGFAFRRKIFRIGTGKSRPRLKPTCSPPAPR